MYTTIEADIDNGIVRSAESSQLPVHAHVLITLLDSRVRAKPDWEVIRSHVGRLRLRNIVPKDLANFRQFLIQLAPAE